MEMLPKFFDRFRFALLTKQTAQSLIGRRVIGIDLRREGIDLAGRKTWIFSKKTRQLTTKNFDAVDEAFPQREKYFQHQTNGQKSHCRQLPRQKQGPSAERSNFSPPVTERERRIFFGESSSAQESTFGFFFGWAGSHHSTLSFERLRRSLFERTHRLLTAHQVFEKP